MYGFIYNTLRNLVILHFNEETWLEICEEAGIEEMKDGILDRHYYEESYLGTLGVTASKRLDLPLETILELFGGFFFVTCKKSGHSSMLRTLGHNLYGFLMNLDSLHDHLAVTFDQMAAPSFRCEKTRTSITLHYYTQRAGLSTIVKGIVKAVADDFFNLDVSIEQITYEQLDEKLAHHYVFYLECTDSARNTGNYLERLTGDLDASLDATMLPDMCDDLEDVPQPCPINIMQDGEVACPVTMSVPDLTKSGMRLLIPSIRTLDTIDDEHVSKTSLTPNTTDLIKEQLTKSVTNTSLIGDTPNSMLPRLSSSRMQSRRGSTYPGEFTKWPVNPGLFQSCFPFHIIFDKDLVIKYMGISFMRIFPKAVTSGAKLSEYFVLNRPAISLTYSNICLAIHNIFIISANKSSSKSESCEVVPFRGQMVPTSSKEGADILFIGSPRVNSIEDLEHQGLYLSDIPVHDVTRDLILLNQHFHVERNIAAELQEMKRDLEVQKANVEREKHRADTLLESMLPKSIANELKTGAQSSAMDFPLVTILFSDIKGFTTICNSCNPFQVVGMLNDLYTLFDAKSEYHNVYKVETIGDAYMVAAGLLDTAKEPTEAVAKMAFSMREEAGKVLEPVNKIPLQIRIGIHAGPVVAGVVGVRMPRFCLFGDTVNTASRMESHGAPGKIHLSGSAYNEIKNMPFRFYSRGYIDVKGLGMRETYFIEQLKEGEEPGLEYLPDANLNPEKTATPEKKPASQPSPKEMPSDQNPIADITENTLDEQLLSQKPSVNQKPTSNTPAPHTPSPAQRPKPDGSSPDHPSTPDLRPVPDGTSPEHASIADETSPDHIPILKHKPSVLDESISIQSLSPQTSPDKTAETTVPNSVPGLESSHLSEKIVVTPGVTLPLKPHAVSAASLPEDVPTPDVLKPCRVKLPPLNRPHINAPFPAEEQDKYNSTQVSMVKPYPPEQAWSSDERASSSNKAEEGHREEVPKTVEPIAEKSAPHEVTFTPPKNHLVEVRTRKKCIIS